MNYKESGVDVEKGDLFIERIKPFIKETYNNNVYSGVGGFAALYDQGDFYLAAGTDGVGTKIKLAIELNLHDTIGEDLVAMCVNDILCTGATPMFFLDYLASSKLNLEIHQDVIKGIANGCKIAGCALIGGETAEMPGMYQNDDYDLAGFVVGSVLKTKVIDGKKLKNGMKIYALPASGFHSNGFSLIRKIIENESLELKRQCLTPTKIYAKEVFNMLRHYDVYGIAHITGGGLNNIKRINNEFGYSITQLPKMPEFMSTVINKLNLSPIELYTTFNMGIGQVFIMDSCEKITEVCPQIIEIGYVHKNSLGVSCLGTKI